MKKVNKAFTLIELLVVISIIALLVSILMPALSKARQQAKMVVCSSNIHQLVIGVSTYAADNSDTLPPSSSNAARPCLLARNKASGDTYQFKYLGKYLQDVSIFMCPVSGFDSSMTKNLGGVEYTYQEIYENIDDWFNNISDDFYCSYNLFWNYNRFADLPAINSDNDPDSRLPSKPFKGPGKNSKNQLLVSDSFNFSGALSPKNTWYSTHNFKGASKQIIDGFPYYAGSTGAGTINDIDNETTLQKIQLNAGYLDASVRTFSSGDSIRQLANSGWAQTFMPDIQEWK